MMTREYIGEFYPDALLLDEEMYDNAILGVSHDGRVVYSYNKLIKALVKRYEI